MIRLSLYLLQSLRGLGLPIKSLQTMYNPKARYYLRFAIITSMQLIGCLVGLAEVDGAFYIEDIPQQKMVMRPYRPQENKAMAENVKPSTEVSASLNTEQVVVSTSTENITEEQSHSEIARPMLDRVKLVKDSQQTDTSVISDQEATLHPYEMIPEEGQKPAIELPKLPQVQMASQQKLKKKPDAYASNRITQWVNEVSMNMFTYSGDHLNRDRNHASQFFSPEAWQTVDQFLFQRADSPFLDLKKFHGNSRAMAIDWPIALHTDTSKRGKIWWVKVPVSALIRDSNAVKRAFFEVKLGVLPIVDGNQTKFIAEEVIIKQINMQKRKQNRGARHVR